MRPEPQGTFNDVTTTSLTARRRFAMVDVMKVPVSENPSNALRWNLEYQRVISSRDKNIRQSARTLIISQFEQFPEVLLAVAVLSTINTIKK